MLRIFFFFCKSITGRRHREISLRFTRRFCRLTDDCDEASDLRKSGTHLPLPRSTCTCGLKCARVRASFSVSLLNRKIDHTTVFRRARCIKYEPQWWHTLRTWSKIYELPLNINIIVVFIINGTDTITAVIIITYP
jgi:hypothetical protein